MVVFGITSEIKPALLERVDTRVRVDGSEVAAESFSGPTLTFPIELETAPLDDGAEVELVLEAFAGGEAVVTRTAATEVASGRKILFPVRIDAECAEPTAPSCGRDQTCDNGACADPFKSPEDLPDYYEGWQGSNGGDKCEPGGPPEVFIGEGQAAYLPLDDGAVVQVEAGPQGGYHVWLAARLRNLKQSGSVTEITGRVAELAYDVPVLSVVFTFDPDEGSYCKIYGLRFRLDDEAHPIESLLGKDVDVTLTITDPDGDVGTATKRLRLSDNFI
jgi:hypothetical protein